MTGTRCCSLPAAAGAVALLLGAVGAPAPTAARRGWCCCGSWLTAVAFVPGLSRSIRHSHLHLTAHAPLPPLPSNVQPLTCSVHAHAAGSSAECGISVLRCMARDVMTWSMAALQRVKPHWATLSLTAPSALTPPGSCATSQRAREMVHIT
jgi:hypothetical protein